MPKSGQPQKSLAARKLSRAPAVLARGWALARSSTFCSSRSKFFLALALLMVAAPMAKARLSAHAAEAGDPARRAQRVVDALRVKLGLMATVVVRLVDHDARMASVRADADAPGGFVIALQRDFVTRLSPAQLEAVLAHELGHVWVSTHHPYLQTEQLANRIAMRLVSREMLVEVYQTVWGVDELHGSFEKFLGVESTVAASAQQQ